jgi:hypothetical protein
MNLTLVESSQDLDWLWLCSSFLYSIQAAMQEGCAPGSGQPHQYVASTSLIVHHQKSVRRRNIVTKLD